MADVGAFRSRVLTKMTDQASGFILGTPRGHLLEEPGRHDDRRRAHQARRLRPGEEVRRCSASSTAGRRASTGRSLQSDARYYPSDIWAARGALILKVNYRGSAGYGEKFRQLNVRNLGVGDAWDVLSGVDYLIAQGWVDPAKRRLHGLEPGRLHLGVPDHVVDALRGHLGRRRASPTGRPTTTTPTSRRSRSTTWAPIRSPTRRSTARRRR